MSKFVVEHDQYQLKPDSRAEPEVAAPVQLQERQEGLADVPAMARIEIANLYQQLAGSGYAVMLTDREGVLLNDIGGPTFTHAASKTGLMQGAVWSERVQGTKGGAFREDLYYRLPGVTFTLPPLRERLDRGALLRQRAGKASEAGCAAELDKELLALLERQRWPGKLRQRRHLLRVMIARPETDRLTMHDLPPEYRHHAAGIGALASAPVAEPAKSLFH